MRAIDLPGRLLELEDGLEAASSVCLSTHGEVGRLGVWVVVVVDWKKRAQGVLGSFIV